MVDCLACYMTLQSPAPRTLNKRLLTLQAPKGFPYDHLAQNIKGFCILFHFFLSQAENSRAGDNPISFTGLQLREEAIKIITLAHVFTKYLPCSKWPLLIREFTCCFGKLQNKGSFAYKFVIFLFLL